MAIAITGIQYRGYIKKAQRSQLNGVRKIVRDIAWKEGHLSVASADIHTPVSMKEICIS